MQEFLVIEHKASGNDCFFSWDKLLEIKIDDSLTYGSIESVDGKRYIVSLKELILALEQIDSYPIKLAATEIKNAIERKRNDEN